jgi:hypothetical protein
VSTSNCDYCPENESYTCVKAKSVNFVCSRLMSVGSIDSSKLISVLKHNKKVETKPETGHCCILTGYWPVFRALRVGTLKAQLTGETHWVSFEF